MIYITYAETPHEDYHRSRWIIRKDFWYFAEFDDEEQLRFFAQTLGFTYKLRMEKPWTFGGEYREYDMDKMIEDHYSFWHLSDLPEGAKPIKALSNGSIVTCYYVTEGDRIKFYRPNPNAKEVYHPLDVGDHIAHLRIYGCY